MGDRTVSERAEGCRAGRVRVARWLLGLSFRSTDGPWLPSAGSGSVPGQQCTGAFRVRTCQSNFSTVSCDTRGAVEYKTCSRPPAPAVVVYRTRPASRAPRAPVRRRPSLRAPALPASAAIISRRHSLVFWAVHGLSLPPLQGSAVTPPGRRGLCLRLPRERPRSPSDPDLITGTQGGPYARAVLAAVDSSSLRGLAASLHKARPFFYRFPRLMSTHHEAAQHSRRHHYDHLRLCIPSDCYPSSQRSSPIHSR